MKKLPKYEFLIDNTEGMTAISLVDSPAMESSFIAFNNVVEKPKYIVFEKYKQIVAGLALIPDKLIFRVDEKTGLEYYGYFSSDTIEKIRNKFHQQKLTDNVNLQHNEDYKIDSYLVESYILDTPERVLEVKNRGIGEAVLGAWFVSYKVEDPEVFQLALDGTFTGFSVEVMLNKELRLNKTNINMKMKSFIDKFKSLLFEFEDVKLVDAVLADGSKNVRYDAVGTPVNWVTVDEQGVEGLELAPMGEYILESGEILVVDEAGNLVEVKPAEAPIEPEDPNATPVDPAALVEDEPTEEVPLVDPIVPEMEPEMPEGDVEPAPVPRIDKTISDVVGVLPGEYWIKVVVNAEGMIEEAEVSSEVSLLNAQVETLQAQLKLPIAEPQKTNLTCAPKKRLTKEEMAKLSNLELTRYKLGMN